MKSLRLKFVVVVEVSLKVNSLKMSIERIFFFRLCASDYALKEDFNRDFYFTSIISLNNRIMTLTLSYFYENE